MLRNHHWKAAIGVAVGLLGGGLIGVGCSSGGADRRTTATITLFPVPDCNAAKEALVLWPSEDGVPAADAGDAAAAANIGLEWLAQIDGGFANIITKKPMRLRAAARCLCLAQENYGNASRNGTASDVLVGGGAIGAAGGAVLSGVAANSDDADTRKALLTAGIISTGVGSLAFGLAAALGLSKRATTADTIASEQEIAAAILLNDSASQEAWGRAFATCATDQGSLSSARPDNAADIFRDASAAAQPPSDAGNDAPNDASADAADAQVPNPGRVPTALDSGRD